MKNTIFILMIMFSAEAIAQNTITISTGEWWKDALLLYHEGDPNLADNNYKNYSGISAVAWTASGTNTFYRTLMYFNLDTIIPTGSTINSATLYLYSDPEITSSSAYNGNSQLSGSNAVYIEKVTDEWNDGIVTWNNQPAVTTNGRIWVGPSTSTTENREINLTSLMQEWVNDPIGNNGMRIILENEVKYRSRNYASTDHSNSSIHPKLVISYTPDTTATCGTPDISEEEYTSLPWYGDSLFLDNFYDSLYNEFNDPNLRVEENIWFRIPVQFWYYIDGSNPGRIFDEMDYQLLMDRLNDPFRNNEIPMRFYIHNISVVNEPDALELGGFFEQESLANNYRNSSALNIHIIESFSKKPNRTGVYNPLYNAVFITRSTSSTNRAFSNTIVHEVGHFYSLLHTHIFRGIPCLREPVSRGKVFSLCPNTSAVINRCLLTGDLFCDTDADPDMGKYGTYDDENCVWYNNNGKKDPYGQLYHPHPRNIMAYGNRPCRSFFSTKQKQAMLYWASKRQSNSTEDINENNSFDTYEPDNEAVAARTIDLNSLQEHSFHQSGRQDFVDWMQFRYVGSDSDLQLEITNITSNAVNEVNIYPRISGGSPGARLNIPESTVGNTTTYDISCSALTAGNIYLIEVVRGSISQTAYYNAELKGNDIVMNAPDEIGCDNTTITLSNVSPGSTIKWTKSSNLTYVSGNDASGNGTSNYTVTANGAGDGFVQAAISNGSCNITIHHPVTVTGALPTINSPYINQEPYYDLYPICPGYITLEVTPEGDSDGCVAWTFPPEVTSPYYISCNLAEFYLESYNSEGLYIITATASNPCGTTGFDFVLFYDSYDCGPSLTSTSVYPNPSSDEIIVETNNTGDEESEEINGVIIFDRAGNKIKEVKQTGNKVTVPVKELRNGDYILHVQYLNKIIKHHIKIKR